MSSEREGRGPGELREAVLGLLLRKMLFEEPKPLAYQIGKELGFSHDGDHSVDACLKECRNRGFVIQSEDRSYEITREGCFELWDSLRKSERFDELSKMRTSSGLLMKTNYDRQRAEAIFATWYKEWENGRKSTAIRATNILVGSA